MKGADPFQNGGNMVYYTKARQKEAAGMQEESARDYVVVKALENGVNLIGMTRGRDTRLLHTEKMDAGEVIVAQFTENTSAMKIRGRARIYTAYGVIETGPEPEEGSQSR